MTSTRTAAPTRPAQAGDGAGPLVQIREVSRTFGSTVALDRVSLTIEENAFFALLGPSGCGKTTLLRVLAGFEHPDSGTVLLGGEDLLALPANRRPVNLMFQSYALFPHMDVQRNVAYGLAREGVARAERRRRVDEVLEVVGLSGQARRRPHELSGGQRQRVALARAVVKRPRLLLLDEPLSALDRKVRAEMQLELKRLQSEVGITFAIVTHDQEEAMSVADRIAVLESGRVQQVATPVELYRRPANHFVADFIGTSNLLPGEPAAGGLVVPGVGLLPGHDAERATGPAHLLVRPEDARLTARGSGRLAGRVLQVRFLGGTSTVTIVVDALIAPVVVVVPGVAPVDAGDEVGIEWDADRALVVRS